METNGSDEIASQINFDLNKTIIQRAYTLQLSLGQSTSAFFFLRTMKRRCLYAVSQSYLLSIQCNRWRYIPSLDRIYIANVNDLKTHFGIICARRWISYGTGLRKCTAATTTAQSMYSHHSSSRKPWICHCANICIVKRGKHNVCAII